MGNKICVACFQPLNSRQQAKTQVVKKNKEIQQFKERFSDRAIGDRKKSMKSMGIYKTIQIGFQGTRDIIKKCKNNLYGGEEQKVEKQQQLYLKQLIKQRQQQIQHNTQKKIEGKKGTKERETSNKVIHIGWLTSKHISTIKVKENSELVYEVSDLFLPEMTTIAREDTSQLRITHEVSVLA